ncbi:hypothetical protein Cgig2_008729 [Carnegiea gigantea]|uniref:Deubiquitinating enzyme MINDY-3/4 conserved domain-containing protein n=1 Tax=Carnegiea gigantea TaxID=171969 RepID=A0A9Q1KEN7_9CARY|nr:hypothetical protein Cgig2_008729 [Carnegiea gigantea]
METRQTLPAPPLPYLTRAIDQSTQRSQAATLAVLHSQPCPYCHRRSHPHTVDEELAGGDFLAVRPPLLLCMAFVVKPIKICNKDKDKFFEEDGSGWPATAEKEAFQHSSMVTDGQTASANSELGIDLLANVKGDVNFQVAEGFVLKYLLFVPEQSSSAKKSETSSQREPVTPEQFASLPEETRKRALVRSMAEILFRCGSNKKAVIATLDVLNHDGQGNNDLAKDEIILKALEGISIESALDLQKSLRAITYNSYPRTLQKLEEMIPVFESRMGAMLFLISTLLSRGLNK